jgi:hypothetical protein
MKQARVLKIVLASPGEVQVERKATEKYANKLWYFTNSVRQGF